MDDDLKAFLTEQFGALRTEITTDIKALDAKMEAKFLHHEAVLTEKMRDMQTELLRGFQAFSAGYDMRMRKMEADSSNLDTALSGRVNIVENRLTQIEIRLGLSMLPPTPPAPPAA